MIDLFSRAQGIINGRSQRVRNRRLVSCMLLGTRSSFTCFQVALFHVPWRVLAGSDQSISMAQRSYQEPNTKLTQTLQQDKRELASLKSRAQGCCAIRTGKQAIQLDNLYAILSIGTG